MNLALLVLRIASSMAFLFHGSQILFGAFGGTGPEKFAAFMHMPPMVGYLVGLAQFAGGLAILTGILIRIGALCIIVVMAGAVYLVHFLTPLGIGQNGHGHLLSQLFIR